MPNTREKLKEILDDNATCLALGIKSCDECAYGRCEDCYTEALADHLIANGVRLEEKQATSDETSKWIPVTERLPELHTRVICCGPKGGVFIAETRLCAAHVLWDDRQRIGKRNVTHWMPLPEPPKGE